MTDINYFYLIRIISSIKHRELWLLLLAYCTLTFIATFFHEGSRDEAQVWLICRDLHLKGIFQMLSSMGHPGLWYACVSLLVKCGLPYFSMFLLQWLCTCCAAAIFLFKAPFPKYLRCLFLFSWFMLFEYAVPARNYAISILILFCLLLLFHKQHERPFLYSLLLLLLFSSNTLFFGAAIALSAVFIYEAIASGINFRRHLLPITIIFTGAALFFLQMLQPSHNVTVRSDVLPKANLDLVWGISTSIQNAFMPVSPENENLKLALIFSLLFGILICTLRRSTKSLIFILLSAGWVLYIFATRFPGAWRHEGLLMIFLLAAAWIMLSGKRAAQTITPRLITITCALSFAATLPMTFRAYKNEIQHQFSGSTELAEFIQSSGLSQEEFVSYPSFRIAAVAALLPRAKFYMIERAEYGTYYLLDSSLQLYNRMPQHELLSRVMNNRTSCLLITEKNYELNSTEDLSVTKIFSNRKFIWATNDEEYALYLLTRI